MSFVNHKRNLFSDCIFVCMSEETRSRRLHDSPGGERVCGNHHVWSSAMRKLGTESGIHQLCTTHQRTADHEPMNVIQLRTERRCQATFPILHFPIN